MKENDRHNRFLIRSGRVALILSVAAVLAYLTAALAGRAYSQRALPGASSISVTEAPATPSKPAAAASATQSGPNKTEPFTARIITIRRMGMEPREITCPKGRVLLAVHNRTGLDEVVLNVDRVGGSRLHQERLSSGKADWRVFANFTPGSYVLSEANHPEWSCNITVTPN